MASGNRSHRHARTPVIDLTQIKGRDSKDESVNATNLLKAVVDEVDPHTEILHIVGDTPTNAEWEILAHHFTNVRFLKVATGWDEAWNDDKFPLNWPLEQLVIADAVAERITTPAIMEGRIQRLVLLFTAALRFEGPDSKELMKNAEQLDMPGPDSQGVKVYSLPYEWHKWFYNHYKGKQPTFSPDPGSSPPSAMRHLQILGNDALQMLSYMALAKFHLLASLSSLTIFSPGSHDMQHIAPHTPPLFLSLLHNLKSLKLTLGSAMYATLLDQQQQQAFLHVFLPPDLETLHFRGPVTMAAHLDEFAAAFAQHDTFLPRLRRISVVLDLPDKASDSPREASLEQLRVAHRACRRLLDAAVRERGAVAEGFAEPWVEEHGGLFWEVDDRWGVLDEMAAPGR
ncbi:hypothetical protein N658DRAFT_418830 [Parathielavia hyrcaniae]|uniref:Uncharacterized protein n=1 Tax=Parathielavia hyrcaniae TaxID=113614 RepID=A0AAN6Q9Z2_9PEZI|nr:hypothetical protein N658DRAFT_418830 [Parathielavia hyrcaniae]